MRAQGAKAKSQDRGPTSEKKKTVSVVPRRGLLFRGRKGARASSRVGGEGIVTVHECKLLTLGKLWALWAPDGATCTVRPLEGSRPTAGRLTAPSDHIVRGARGGATAAERGPRRAWEPSLTAPSIWRKSIEDNVTRADSAPARKTMPGQEGREKVPMSGSFVQRSAMTMSLRYYVFVHRRLAGSGLLVQSSCHARMGNRRESSWLAECSDGDRRLAVMDPCVAPSRLYASSGEPISLPGGLLSPSMPHRQQDAYRRYLRLSPLALYPEPY